MPVDTSIYANIKQPTQYSLGDIMGLATGAQNLQTGKIRQQREAIGLQQDTSDLNARKAVGDVVNDPQYHDPETGLFDLNKAAPAMIQADPQDRFASKQIANLAKANADLITVKKASLGLADTSRTMLGSTVGALANKPDLSKADIYGSLAEQEAQAPDTKPIIDVWKRGLANLPDDPKVLQQVVMKARSQVMPPTAQIESQTPSGPVVDNGQVVAPMNVKPTAGETGPIAGTVTAKQLPPTTPIFNGGTNQPGYLGPTGGAPGPARGGFVASGPPLGTEANIAGTVKTANDDWIATNESARTASQDIGVLQNIKKYAPGAVTGVANDRRAYLTGLAGLLGMEPEQLEKTKTDLLEKNSKMIALAGGDTNLAKLMSESANPNTHMTKEAIAEAANQVIAQRKLALAKQQYMGHFKADPQLYNEELARFNSIADPRALQLPDMSKEEKAHMLSAMSETERREFIAKTRRLQAIGILK